MSTAVRSWVDDDGSNTTGTLLDKGTLVDALSAAAVCGGRLTLTTALAVTTADVTGATTVYYTPHKGDRIGLYDGTSWVPLLFAEVSIALGTVTSGLPYDIWGYDNAGTFTLEKLAWTNGTTRATAYVLQNGVKVKSGATTRRLLGTIYTTSTTATEDSNANRYVYNEANRVAKPLRRRETNSVWTYNTGTIRQARASPLNQVGIMNGAAEGAIDLSVLVTVTNDTNATIAVTGIGEDSTTTISVDAAGGLGIVPAANIYSMVTSRLCKMPTVGVHFYAWLERGNGAAGSTQWFGVSTVGEAPTGLEGVWEC